MKTDYQSAQNECIEISFQSNKAYQDPFRDIDLSVQFTAPDGTTITVPGFWHGELRWSVRYSANQIGQHQFKTVCSDTANTDLHAQNGDINITPYTGNNPLLKHGAIKVAEDGRHFAHQDETPFLWMGDTWWMGLSDRLSWPNDFQALAQNRQALGFNVIQIVAGLYPDMPAFDARGENKAGFAWEKDFYSINPAFYDAADARIEYLVSQGLVPCILGCWGYYLEWLGVDNMKRHWRYLMARWGALPVVWVASGEQTMPWYLHDHTEKPAIQATLKQEWSDVMREMHQLNAFKRMITTHPMHSARESVDDNNLIDFDMQQTGHGTPPQQQAEQALKGWYTQPKMPVISGESRYEALEIIPPVTTKDVRQAFWTHLINCGIAGHTYGANGIWQVNLPNQPFGNSPNGHNWGTLAWNDAIHLPAAKQLGIAKRFLASLPWHTLYTYLLNNNLSPATQKLLAIKSPWFKKWLNRLLPNLNVQTPIAAAKTLDQQLALFYTITDQPFKVNLTAFKEKTNAYWFDPCSGNQIKINTKDVIHLPYGEFVPVGPNADGDHDWLLVIQAAT